MDCRVAGKGKVKMGSIQVEPRKLEEMEKELQYRKECMKRILDAYTCCDAEVNVFREEKDGVNPDLGCLAQKLEYWGEVLEEVEWFCRVVTCAGKQYARAEQEILEMLEQI